MAIEGDDFESREFRRGVWQQTATTVALITTCHEGVQDVMACEWAMMVSGAPLRFVVSVAPSRRTHELIEGAGEFGLNFCSADQVRLSHISGSYSLKETDKWSMADFAPYPGRKIDAPMLAGCPLNVECRLVETLPLGDHTLFVGEAVWAAANDSLDPLIYHAGKYFRIGDQVPKS